MNIVYGGSFNPPTLAHLEIINDLIKKFNPDHFIIVPVGSVYTHKSDLVSDTDRYNMLKILTKDMEVLISKVELNSDEYLGTYNTLNSLSEFYPDIYFVIGADNLYSFDQWIRFSDLISKYKIIVLTRSGYDILDLITNKYYKYRDHFTVVEYNSSISASAIRGNLELNKKYLTNEVYEYIKKRICTRRWFYV